MSMERKPSRKNLSMFDDDNGNVTQLIERWDSNRKVAKP